MAVEIRETTITPTQDGDVVQLHISDAPPDDESAEIVLRLIAKLPKHRNPALVKLHWEVIELARKHLEELRQKLQDQAEEKMD